MTIIKEGKLNKLKADEGYLLKEKEDNYMPEYIDKNGTIIEEHLPYSFLEAYLPESITLEMAQNLYDELPKDEYPWKEKTFDEIWEEALLNGVE